MTVLREVAVEIDMVIKAGHIWLAVYAVMMSLIGAFYYLPRW